MCPAVHSPFSAQAVDSDHVQDRDGNRDTMGLQGRPFKLEETLAFQGPGMVNNLPKVTQQIVAESNLNSTLYPSPEPFASFLYYCLWPEGGTHGSWRRMFPRTFTSASWSAQEEGRSWVTEENRFS